MPYEDAAPLFATGVRVCVIVYYYDEVEKQILPSFGYTLKRAIGRSGGGEAAKGFDALCSALGKPVRCALFVLLFGCKMQDGCSGHFKLSLQPHLRFTKLTTMHKHLLLAPWLK